MGISVYESEEDREERIRGKCGGYPLNSMQDTKVHVNALDSKAASLILKTEKVATDFGMEMPCTSGLSLKGRVSLDKAQGVDDSKELENEFSDPNLHDSIELHNALSDFQDQLTEVHNEGKVEFPHAAWESIKEKIAEKQAKTLAKEEALIELEKKEEFPNVAYEFVKLGLAKEKFVNEQINGHVREANKIQKQIDLLLDLQGQLNALSNEASEMTQEMKDIIAELKELGVDVWKEEKFEINKEKVSKLKSHASSQVDKLRSNLQIIFTTKIQVFIQMISSILEIVKESIHNDTRGKSRILQNMSGR